jgi:phosphatidylethanolamine-binding protein
MRQRRHHVITIRSQVKYLSGVEVNEGNELTPTQVKDVPTVSWDAVPDQFYTLAMTGEDPFAI